MIQTKKDELDYIASQLQPTIMESLKQYSVGVGEIELSASLEGVNSLPALKREGGVDKIVEVPLQLITAPADDAIQKAEEAANKANQAAQNANDAAEKVTDAVLDLTEERARIDEAISNAQEATDAANAAKDNVLAGEAGRVEAEEARVAAEQTRVQAEQERNTAEQSRIAAEAGRVAAEKERVIAEENRVSEFATIKKEAETATKNADDAASAASSAAREAQNMPKIENGNWWVYDFALKQYRDTNTSATGRSPKIQDGTWWVYDDVTGEYVNTTISVSSDYELTKQKVENVLTGDIQTHYHSQYTVPTLDKVPDETTLTFKDGENTCNFVIGQFARVADSESEQGYSFYQLYDISDGKAVWAQGGSGGGDVREKVRINLSSNQPQPDDALVGATVVVHDDTTDQDLYSGVWNGTEILVKVTPMSDFTVSVGDVEGYKTPAAQQFTASIQGDRTVAFVYNACLLSVDLITNQAEHEDVQHASITVAYDSVSKTISSGQSIKVPMDATVSVTAAAVDRYATPAKQQFMVSTASKAITMTYNTCVLTVTAASNQSDKSDIDDVSFTVVSGSMRDTVSSGQTVKVAYGVQATITASEVTDYKTPASQSFTPDSANKALSFTYNTCLLTVTTSGLKGEPHTISVKYDATTKNPSSGDTVKVPYGVSVTVSVSDVEGYAKPSDVVFTPNSASKTVDMPYTESAVRLTIASNQPDDDTIAAVKATLSYGDTNVQISNGQTVAIPVGTSVSITFPDVTGYKTPAKITFTNLGGLVEKSATYQTEVVTVTVSTDNSTSVNGQKVTINGTQYTYAGIPITQKIPFDTLYSISVDAKSGYTAPDTKQFTAEQVSRSVTMTYTQTTDSYIIFDKSISDPANISGDINRGVIAEILSKFRRCLCKKTADGEVTIAYLRDDNSNYYEDGTSAILDGTEGDVMVDFPEFYYKWENVDGNKFRYRFALSNIDGNYKHVSRSLVGAYKGYVESEKLYSRSGVKPAVEISHFYFKDYSKRRGTGYQIIDYQQHCVIAFMLYAKYGNRNIQAVLGTGGAVDGSSVTITGTSNSTGIADTNNEISKYVCGLGIEGVFGGIEEFVEGVTVSDNLWVIKDPEGSTRMLNSVSSVGWITNIAAEDGPYFDMVPTQCGGSDSTYYSDRYNTKKSSNLVVARSGNKNSTTCGVAFADVFVDEWYSGNFIGSRLAFRGIIQEEKNVSEFKSLPVL